MWATIWRRSYHISLQFKNLNIKNRQKLIDKKYRNKILENTAFYQHLKCFKVWTPFHFYIWNVQAYKLVDNTKMLNFIFKYFIILPNHRMLIMPLWIDDHLLCDLDSDSGNYFSHVAFLFLNPCDVFRLSSLEQ